MSVEIDTEKAGGKKRHGGCSWPQHIAVAAVRRWRSEACGLVKGLGPLQESRRLSVHCVETAFGLGPWQGVLERLVDRHSDRVLFETAVSRKGLAVAATATAATTVSAIFVRGEQDGVHGLSVVLQVLAIGNKAWVFANLVEPLGCNRFHRSTHKRIHGEDGVKMLHRQGEEIAVGFGTDACHPFGIR